MHVNKQTLGVTNHYRKPLRKHEALYIMLSTKKAASGTSCPEAANFCAFACSPPFVFDTAAGSSSNVKLRQFQD